MRKNNIGEGGKGIVILRATHNIAYVEYYAKTGNRNFHCLVICVVVFLFFSISGRAYRFA